MKESKIQWTNNTVNFWTGCKKYSEGCEYCYMFRDKERYGQDPTKIVRTSDDTFYKALSWKDPRMIFTCSWSDFFLKEADAWRDDAWEVIRKTPQHQWQILTKRSARIYECLPKDWGSGYENVWLGVSIENQKNMGRIDELVSVPTKVPFVSFEPLLGEISHPDLSGIEWMIIGGESGNKSGRHRYRPCSLNWITKLIEAGEKKNIPIFVKQLGCYLAGELNLRSKKGEDVEEFPEYMKRREFPILEDKESPKLRQTKFDWS